MSADFERATLAKVAESTRERIKARSKHVGISPVFLERRFVVERFLWRFRHSEHWASRFMLKGGLLLLTLGGMERPTDDADLHMEEPLSADDVRQMAADLSSIRVNEPDGLIWMPEDAKIKPIIELAVTGLRVSFPVRWANETRPDITIPLKLDLSWGGEPLAGVERHLPVVLPKNFSSFLLRMYRWEQVVAEKVHALARHGLSTSRMKDFYDLVLIANSVDLDATSVARAIRQVFGTWGNPPLSGTLLVLQSPGYPAQREEAWKLFVGKKNDVRNPSPTLEHAVQTLRPLIIPLLTSIADGEQPTGVWKAGSGRWTFTHRSMSGSDG